MNKEKSLRVMVAKPGLDGHDRGARIVARALRDGGMEVIYTGLHQTPIQIVNAAAQEDVDAIGLSILSGAHMTLFEEVMGLLRENGMSDVLVFGGGTIPKKDKDKLQSTGVGEIFTPGTDTRDIIEYLKKAFDFRG